MTLLEMSLTGAVLTAVVAGVRALALHRLPKGTLLALWWLVLARFLLPVSLPSPVSVYTLGASISSTRWEKVTAAVTAPQPLPEALPAAVTEGAAPLPESSALLPMVWMVGSAVCALYFTVVSARCRREFRMSLPVSDPTVDGWLAAHPLRRSIAVRVSDRISAPLTYGIFQPVILLPLDLDRSDVKQLDLVLTHEWVHILRFDSLLKLLLAAAACLHWWNPMVWVMYELFNYDLELSCDEAVVRRCGSRADYARALIRLEEHKSGLAPFCSSFNQNAMEERILAIMKMKKWTRRTTMASVAAVFAVGALFATSAAVDPVSAATDDAAGNGNAAGYWYPKDRVDWIGERELLEQFKAFGISYDAEGKMYFNGERVRWFWDGYEIWEDGSLLGWSMRYEYLDKDGTVDVRTIHSTIDNGDGSLDYYGPLTDIVAYSQEEFDSRTYESIRRDSAEATTVDDAVLVEDKADPGSGQIEIYSEVEDAVAFSSREGLFTGSGETTETFSEGPKVYSSDAVVEDTIAFTTDSGTSAGGRTLSEIFAEYSRYGITYREQDGSREVFYEGEPVNHFADIKPDGSAFSFSSIGGEQSTLSVRTVYDATGKLTGVQPYRQSAD